MLKVYLIDTLKIKQMKEKLPSIVTKHINQYRNKKAKKISLVTWQCLNYLLHHDFNCDLKTISFNKSGKPYLKNKKMYFSLSHSFNMIAIAISNNLVGIDIEKIIDKKFVELLSERILDKQQTQKYHKVKNKQEYLTKIWTLKETQIKLNGCDINILRDIKCINTFNNTFKTTDLKKNKYYVSCINKKHEKISEVIKWKKK